MSLTLQILLTGLAAGSVYGLLAVGNTLVFRLTGIVHFALGDLVGLGVFVALLVTAGRGPVTQASASSWRFALALAVGLVVTAGLSAGSYSAFIHPYVVRGLDGRLGGGERGDRVRDRGAPPRALHPAGVRLPRSDPISQSGERRDRHGRRRDLSGAVAVRDRARSRARGAACRC